MLFSLCAFSAISMIPQHVDAAQSLEGDSIYQIMVDRFYDGDSSNNAKGEAFRNTENTQDDFRYMHGGDWQGVIDKIDYIKGMGYTAIWISPVSDPQLWGCLTAMENSGQQLIMDTMFMILIGQIVILDARMNKEARKS